MDVIDHFETVKDYFLQHICPCVCELVEGGEESDIKPVDLGYNKQKEQEFMSLISTIVEECSSWPEEVFVYSLTREV